MEIIPEWPVFRRIEIQLRRWSHLYDFTSFSTNILFYTCPQWYITTIFLFFLWIWAFFWQYCAAWSQSFSVNCLIPQVQTSYVNWSIKRLQPERAVPSQNWTARWPMLSVAPSAWDADGPAHWLPPPPSGCSENTQAVPGRHSEGSPELAQVLGKGVGVGQREGSDSLR